MGVASRITSLPLLMTSMTHEWGLGTGPFCGPEADGSQVIPTSGMVEWESVNSPEEEE
jgi:hypothetical protein